MPRAPLKLRRTTKPAPTAAGSIWFVTASPRRPRRNDRTIRDPKMATSKLIRTKLLLALSAAFGFAATGYAPAADDLAAPVIQFVGSDSTSRFVPLGIGKSVVIDLP